MTNISKRTLDKNIQKQLFAQFTQMFVSADNDLMARMFEALFTESEKMMFIKRVAIVILIAEDYSAYTIAKTLCVSDKTVRDIKKQAKAGKYDVFINVTREKSFDKDKFWDTLEVLFRGGLPSMGKDRWKWLDK